jgi:hypothetical protein
MLHEHTFDYKTGLICVLSVVPISFVSPGDGSRGIQAEPLRAPGDVPVRGLGEEQRHDDAEHHEPKSRHEARDEVVRVSPTRQ